MIVLIKKKFLASLMKKNSKLFSSKIAYNKGNIIKQ